MFLRILIFITLILIASSFAGFLAAKIGAADWLLHGITGAFFGLILTLMPWGPLEKEEKKKKRKFYHHVITVLWCALVFPAAFYFIDYIWP